MKKISEHTEKFVKRISGAPETQCVSWGVRKRSFQTRGQLSVKTITSILVGLVVLVIIFFSFRSIMEISEREESVELLNLKASIETRILQQSVRSAGTVVNYSVAVPSSVSKVCFFDANKKYDNLRNPEVTGIFGDDKVNNLFIFTDEGFYPHHIDKVEMDEEKNPLCAKIVDSRITLKLITEDQKTKIEASAEAQDIKCISVFENGDPGKKIDVVFLGYGFDEVQEYNDQVNRYVNNILLEFEPFNKYKDKFNFYRVDDAEISCELKGFIKCDQYEIKKAASNCPNDYIMLLVARSALKDFISPVRSSAIINIAKINTADKPFVLVHEFGHSFADLADEYVDENYYTTVNFDVGDYVNCDSTPCSSWNSIDNTSCYSGCSLKRYFRPTKDSIMRNLNSPTFGPVNEREILRRLLYYE